MGARSRRRLPRPKNAAPVPETSRHPIEHCPNESHETTPDERNNDGFGAPRRTESHYEHFKAVSDRCAQTADYNPLADLFTDDCVYIEQVFGQMRLG